MYIYITKSFEKSCKKLGVLDYSELFRIIKIYPHGSLLKNIAELDHQTCILKGYIEGKRIRVVIVFEKWDNVFIPIQLIRKESRKGYNIRKETIMEDFGGNVNTTLSEVARGEFEIFEF